VIEKISLKVQKITNDIAEKLYNIRTITNNFTHQLR